jgi:hypothetical protein
VTHCSDVNVRANIALALFGGCRLPATACLETEPLAAVSSGARRPHARSAGPAHAGPLSNYRCLTPTALRKCGSQRFGRGRREIDRVTVCRRAKLAKLAHDLG